jgi:hypothetical protein
MVWRETIKKVSLHKKIQNVKQHESKKDDRGMLTASLNCCSCLTTDVFWCLRIKTCNDCFSRKTSLNGVTGYIKVTHKKEPK